MPVFEPGDVVRVPFPYTDGEARQHRPALVVACTGPDRSQAFLLWVLMITSAENRGWSDDVVIEDLATAGLPAPSVVRCAKIATIDASRAERRGQLTASTFAEVCHRLAGICGLSPPPPPHS